MPEFANDAIVASLYASHARLSALFAPAGYGKTVRAKALCERFPSSAVVSAAPGASEGETLAQRALAAVPDAALPSLLVVDDAHCIDDATLRTELATLLERVPETVRILLCSQREPVFSLTDYADAHGVSVFRRAELALTLTDLNHPALFVQNMPLEQLARVLTISNGWPTITLALVRLAREGRLDEALTDIASFAWLDIFDWLEERVISTLPADVCDALVECVACTPMSPEDFATAANGRGLDVALFRDYQLADIGMSGEIRILPMVRMYLFARERARLREMALRAATRPSTQPLAAARLFIHAGALDACERLLDEHRDVGLTLGEYPYPGTPLELLSKAPPYVLYPRVWYGLLPARRAVVNPRVLASEAEELLAGSGLSARLTTLVRAAAAILRYESYEIERAREHHAALLQSIDAADPLYDLSTIVDDYHAGRYRSAIARWRKSSSALLPYSAWYGWIGSYVLRCYAMLGDFERLVQMSRVFATLSAVAPGIACAAATEAAIFAWMMCDDRSFSEYRSEAARISRYYDVPNLWSSVAALYDVVASERDGGLLAWKFLPQMLLSHDRCDLVADVAATSSGSVGLQILFLVREAIADSTNAQGLLQRAQTIAATTDSDFLVQSVEHARAGDFEFGIFRALYRSMRPHAPAVTIASASAPARTVVDVVGLRVERGGETVRVSERVRELLVSLAISRTPLRRDVLLDRLWPDLDGDAAASALKMCVHRARQQLGDSRAIVVIGGTYSLGDTVSSDYEAVVKRANATHQSPLDPQVRAADEALFEALVAGLPAHADSVPWLAPVSAALRDAALAVGERLFRDAMSRGERSRAQATARALIAALPDSETPRALLIGLHRQNGDDAAAEREFRNYAETMRLRFGEEPSPSLRRLAKG